MKNIFITTKSLALCIIMVLLGTGCSGCFSPTPPTPQEIKQAKQESEVEQLRITFFKNEGHEIRLAWGELQAIETDWYGRREELATVCRNIGRDPSYDSDYSLWSERLGQLEKDLARLNEMAGDAFLAYAKFTLALDPVSEGRYQEALQEGLTVAAELRRQYQYLKEFKVSSGFHEQLLLKDHPHDHKNKTYKRWMPLPIHR